MSEVIIPVRRVCASSASSSGWSMGSPPLTVIMAVPSSAQLVHAAPA